MTLKARDNIDFPILEQQGGTKNILTTLDNAHKVMGWR
jgi:hypothetical protein